MEFKNHIGKLLGRNIRRELSPKETEELLQWRQLSPENETLYQETLDPEKVMEKMKAFYATRERVYEKVQRQYPGLKDMKLSNADYEKKDAVLIRKHSFTYSTLTRAAAIIILVFGAGWYFFFNNSNSIKPGGFNAVLLSPDGVSTALNDFTRGFQVGSKGLNIRHNEKGELIYQAANDLQASYDKMYNLNIPRGGEFAIQFPDSTVIWLNSSSKIKYPAHFAKDTVRISVEGEAFIEKPANSNTVLLIFVHAALLQTREARMNIQSYPDDSLSTTSLLEGSAIFRIQDKDGGSGQDIKLSPGEQLQVGEDKLSVFPKLNPNAAAWRNHRTTFHNESLPLILRSVSRWYDADIRYMGPVPSGKYSLDLPRDAEISDVLDQLKKQGVHIMVERRGLGVLN